jgi:hypothetical protein
VANLYRAEFYGWKTVSGLLKVTVVQKFGNHTLFHLDYNISNNQRYLLPPENTPVAVRYGSGPLGVRTTYGYVNHLEDRTDEEGKRYTRIVCVGTSKVLNTATMSTWYSTSRSGVVRSIGERYRFRTVVHNHSEVLDMWATGDMTDFRAINEIVSQIGFRLWIDGATLWMLDPQRVLSSASAASTKVINAKNKRSVSVFKGSNVPGLVPASKRTVQFGVNQSSNEIIETRAGDHTLPAQVLTNPVSGYSKAKYATDGAARAMADQTAMSATLSGDATITPGSPLKFNFADSTPDQYGLWLVNEATHVVSNEGFTTSVSVSRDVNRQATSRAPDLVRRESVDARAVVRDGATWEAERQERIDA